MYYKVSFVMKLILGEKIIPFKRYEEELVIVGSPLMTKAGVYFYRSQEAGFG